MKLSDFVARFLKSAGIEIVFGVTGGAVVHLFDSADNAGIRCAFTHHEQSATFAAQAYARIKGLGAAFFTTGPGGSNAVTGIAAAWLDSIPTIYIGGQVRSSQIKPSSIRQQGVQELDILGIVSPVVKYATVLKDPSAVRYELEKCVHIAMTGRPGPVYLEIPLDFQWANIEELKLSSFSTSTQTYLGMKTRVQEVLAKLYTAKKPLLLLGHGIRLACAEKELDCFLKKTGIPYVTTWNAADLVEGKDPLNLGRPGMFGSRSANLAVQTCDFLCCLGSHLPVAVTTPNYDAFGKRAEIAIINIDRQELEHHRIAIKYSLHLDVKFFLQQALSFDATLSNIQAWRKKCIYISSRYSKENIPESLVNNIDSYYVLSVLNRLAKPQDTWVVDGGGTIVQIAFQTLQVRKGQRILIDAGLCAMGSGLPSAIGAAFASSSGNIICLCGDGSFQFNVQELQTVFHHQLPVKLFIFNNQGYLSIRHTQRDFLGGRYIGSSFKGGVSLPNILDVAAAYQLPVFKVGQANELEETLEKILSCSGPAICEISISESQEIFPRIGFDQDQLGKFVSRPIEDMFPYLSREELGNILCDS